MIKRLAIAVWGATVPCIPPRLAGTAGHGGVTYLVTSAPDRRVAVFIIYQNTYHRARELFGPWRPANGTPGHGGLAVPHRRRYDSTGELVEQAILALVSFSVVLTLYLDRACRSETRQLRAEMNDGFGALRKEMRKAFKSSPRTISARVDDLSTRVNNLDTSVIDLANKVGRVEGRTEVLAAVE